MAASWDRARLRRGGRGPLVFLLPALSSISTRAEMHPLMQRLAAQFPRDRPRLARVWHHTAAAAALDP
jgi:hypothetical protein